ncbi:MAG TPA: hexokinase, partial [Clostridiaceae bacterium]|nr:hexokinase [Clostridiaceae bacterium]
GVNGDKRIVLLNDTVATLLGGMAAYPDREFDGFIGFILGTGTNTCYSEENKNILKVSALAKSEGSMLINVESGGYGKAKRGIIDCEFDNGTVNPGEYSFEKMISGRYQGGVVLAVLKKAAEEGLFSHKFADSIKSVDELTCEEISNFLYYPYSKNSLSMCCGDGTDDRILLYHICDAMIERAAKLVAINLASIMLKTGRGKNPCKPVCIAAEGSTFYKLKLFRYKLDYYIKEFLNDKKGLYCEFVKAENATLVGAAIAGLIN